MLEAVEGPSGFQSLRGVVVDLVEAGMSPDLLIEDMEQLRALISEEHEDIMLEVMDQLVGYCAPRTRILPRPLPGDADYGIR